MIGGPLPPPGPHRDRRRTLWARWASISAKREAALEEEDVQRFLELEEEQEEVEAEVRHDGSRELVGLDLADPEVRARMEEILERERRIQGRLRALRSTTLDEIRRLRSGVEGNARHARDYIRRDEAVERSGPGVDLRT